MTPRTPIVLRQGASKEEARADASPSASTSQKIASPAPSAPASLPLDGTTDVQKLRDEIESCYQSLEKWKQAEAEWKRQSRLFKLITENVTDMITLVDRHCNRQWNNSAYSHIMGYAVEELAGTNALSEVHADDHGSAVEAFEKAVNSGKAQEAEFRTQQKEGGWIHVEAEFIPIIDGTTQQLDCVVMMAHDITEKKNLSEALALASTQSAAAGMVEGMARDFDQILTNTFGNLAIAKNLNGPHNAIAVRLNEIERAMKRARDLIEQMFSLSSSSDQPREKVALEPIVQEATNAVLRGTMIRAEYLFPPNLPEIELDIDSFRHAVRNIVTNSVQAMDNGVIRIVAEYMPQEKFGHQPELALKPGNYVSLTFRDQGHGMSEKTLLHAFEPYFTTRQGSQGLGLTTSLSSIQRMGGTIVADSTPKVGTIMTVYLPAGSAPSASASPSMAATSALPRIGVKKRILLMDDEQMILDIVSRMLTHLGYDVKTCTDGAQAIAAFAKAKSNSEPFDVVLMDLVIPNGVGGQDAVHTIRKIDPHAKVIASSGHLDHAVMLEHKNFGFIASLEKPYKLEKLQQVIEAVIESSG